MRKMRLDMRNISIIDFAYGFFGIKLYPYQKAFVEDQSNRIIWLSGRQTGKSTALACKALYNSVMRAKKVLIVAPVLRQSSIIFDKIFDVISYSTTLSRMCKQMTRSIVHFKNGGSILALPAGRIGYTIRGYSPDLLIIDECAYVPEKVFTALMPSVIASHGKIIMCSTPFGKSGRFYSAFTDPDQDYSKHFTKTVENPKVKAEDLEKERNMMTEQEYRQEYEGEFIEDVDTFISKDLFLSCVDSELMIKQNWNEDIEIKPDRDYFIGLDVARYGTDENVWTLLSVDAAGHATVEAILSTSGKPLTDTVGRTLDLYTKYSIKMIFADETGLGSGAVDLLKEKDVRLVPITFTLNDKADMFKHLKWMMERKKISLPGDHTKLLNQTTNMLQTYTSTGILQLAPELNGHDDFPTSLALACVATVGDFEYRIISQEVSR
jgi:hypothetical protein